MILLEFPGLCLALAFILGAIIGSFLNVCIYRLPLEKSVLWPNSRCFNCLQPVRALDNVPLLSYWRLRGKCRTCGATFSSRYFWIELLTATSFAGLFWLEVIDNIRSVPLPKQPALLHWELVAIWFYHSILVSLLIVVTFTDIDQREIPLAITIPGTILGIAGAALMPWPWPVPVQQISLDGFGPLPAGAQYWPIWWPSFDWMPAGSWQMGLVSSVAGAAMGTGMVRLIRFMFGWAFEKEAMGLGDADLMMMTGAFLGWQSFFFVLGFAVMLGLAWAIILLIRSAGNELPFGPFLAGGAVLTMLFSWWLTASFQPLFFDLAMIIGLAVLFAVVALFMTLAIRMVRLIGQAT